MALISLHHRLSLGLELGRGTMWGTGLGDNTGSPHSLVLSSAMFGDSIPGGDNILNTLPYDEIIFSNHKTKRKVIMARK